MLFVNRTQRFARRVVLFVTLVVLLPLVSQAQTFQTERGHAEFRSEVPLHSFTGTSENLVGQIDLMDHTVDFYIDLNTLKTGIGKRDKDMKKTLDTDQYPFAEFFGQLVTPFDTNSDAVQPAIVRGAFKIHGITKQVEITGSLQKTADGIRVQAAWELDLDDYDIEPPSLLIVKVNPVQDIQIDALLSPVPVALGQ